ncbi:hypothetical protein Tco_1033285 [Tanacetum coccineum]|uniref:Reverse transcriptase Ty1/copia-type domain-containing protein n=1 Tax=Tanacetum coccineum TaxID=301880 RepID=A0ABQ5GFW8_9ASTR
MEETFHVTLSEDDEAISQTSAEGDEVNFNEDFVPLVESPVFTNKKDVPTSDEVDHPQSVDEIESAEAQEIVSSGQSLPLIISPLADTIFGPPVPQDRWLREKYMELVNIISGPLAGITTKSRVRDSEAASARECLYVNFLSEIEPKKLIKALEEEGLVIAMQEELNQFERNRDSRGISIFQEKYVKYLLKKYDLADSASLKCPMLPLNNLGPDESGVSVNETLFRGMIRSLMYLIASRSDIQFSTCLCARYQANPKESHNVAIKRIFRQKEYLEGCQLLGGKLVCWSEKKQSFVAMSSAEAEYMATIGCCAQVAELSPDPIKSLLPPSGEVNADDTADKSLSRTSVQPVTQSKAPTAKNPRKKKISSSTKPEALQSSRIDSSSTQATHLPYAKEFVVPTDAN